MVCEVVVLELEVEVVQGLAGWLVVLEVQVSEVGMGEGSLDCDALLRIKL